MTDEEMNDKHVTILLYLGCYRMAALAVHMGRIFRSLGVLLHSL